AEPGGLWIHTHGLRGAPTYLGEPAGSEAPPLPGGLPGRAGEARAAGARDRGRRLRGPQLVEAEPPEPIADHYDHERRSVVSAPEDYCPREVCKAMKDAGGALRVS